MLHRVVFFFTKLNVAHCSTNWVNFYHNQVNSEHNRVGFLTESIFRQESNIAQIESIFIPTKSILKHTTFLESTILKQLPCHTFTCSQVTTSYWHCSLLLIVETGATLCKGIHIFLLQSLKPLFSLSERDACQEGHRQNCNKLNITWKSMMWMQYAEYCLKV